METMALFVAFCFAVVVWAGVLCLALLPFGLLYWWVKYRLLGYPQPEGCE